MKTRVYIAATAIVLTLGMAFSRIMPSLAALWGPVTAATYLQASLTMMGIYVAIATATLSGLLIKESWEAEQARAALKSYMQGTAKTKLVRDDDFYVQFLAAARAARNYVWIAYLAPYPPTEGADPARLQYYTKLVETIRQRGDVKFRRLIRRTPRNEVWIRELLNALRNQPNMDIALLDDSGAEENPLAISAQVVDGEKVWLVALEGHERQADFRDLFIESAEAAEAMRRYYHRLWARATIVLRSGVVTNDGAAILGA